MVPVQDLLRHRRGRHPGHGLPGRSPAAAPVVPDAVFGLKGEIAVARPEEIAQGVVVLAPHVPVINDEADGGAGGAALEDPGENLHFVGLPPGRGVGLNPGPAPVQLLLDIPGAQSQPGRAAVDHRAQGRTVGLPPGGDPEDLAKGVTCQGSPPSAFPGPPGFRRPPGGRIAGPYRRPPPPPPGIMLPWISGPP